MERFLVKIGMYVPSWPPGTAANGIVTYASHVIPALRYLGHEVYVLTLDKTEDSDAHTIDLKAFQKRPSFWDRAKFKIAPHDAYFSLATQALVDAVKYLVTA